MDLVEYKNYLVKNLSGGYKRRVSIAISMVGNIRYLILDEPTTNLDYNARQIVWSLLQKLK